MHKFREQPIRRQVVVAACVLILPLAAAVVWSANRTRDERLVEAQDQMVSLAVSTAASLDQYLAGLDTLASSLVLYRPVIDREPIEVQHLFDSALKSQPLLLNILVTDRSAVETHSALPLPDAPLGTQLPFLRGVLAEGRSEVSDYMVGRISGKPTVVLGYPVRTTDGAIVGVLGLAVDLLKLRDQLAQIPLPHDSVVTVLDASDRILTRTLDTEKFIGTLQPEEGGSPSRSAAGLGADGNRFYGEAQVTRAPWRVRIGVPRAVVQERWLPLWRRNLAIAAAAFLTYLVLAIWLASVGSRHLNRLKQATQRIAGGDLSPISVSQAPSLEFAEFHRSLGTMATNLRDAQDALGRQIQQERELNERLQLLQGQVVRQERLAAVGLLASGVAHEINNPLQAMLGATELLERTPDLSVEARRLTAFMKTNGGRAREIIRGLSRFSSQQSAPPSLIDLRKVVDDVLRFISAGRQYESVTINVHGDAPHKVSANLTELEQVTLNLLVNALQAVRPGPDADGRVDVRVVDADDRVRLEVIDNGPGVKPEDEAKLFQPFFTTKPVGQGTGLGLSVSYGIIRAIGRSIGYRRNPHRGSTFYFELPAVDVSEPAHT